MKLSTLIAVRFYAVKPNKFTANQKNKKAIGLPNGFKKNCIEYYFSMFNLNTFVSLFTFRVTKYNPDVNEDVAILYA